MKKLRERLTYANVVATLALIVAVGGASAFAATQLPKNSVGTKQLKKSAVTTAKIKDQAVTAAKIQNGVLSGAQINPSTLGTVPNASHATSADNAGTLDGLSASDFTAATEVHTPGRIVVNDPKPGDAVAVESADVTAGPFSVNGRCWQNLGGGIADYAQILVSGPLGTSFSGLIGKEPFNEVSQATAPVNYTGSTVNEVTGGQIMAVAPSGQAVSVIGSAEVNDPTGDCVFGVTVIGP